MKYNSTSSSEKTLRVAPLEQTDTPHKASPVATGKLWWA